MNGPEEGANDPSERGGSTTGVGGTPLPVDLRADHRARSLWAVFLVGPVTWFGHFMLVYLVAEAGCTGGGPGLEVFAPPVAATVTVVATIVAAAVCAAAAWWGYRWWRAAAATVGSHEHLESVDDRRSGSLAFVGFVLSTFSVVAVLFTGAPALVFGSC